MCGYAVEWVRSCYVSTWRLFAGSSQETRGYYYFSPPGTPHYPNPHLLGSRNWTSDERDPVPLLGETDFSPRPYFKGSPPVIPPPAVLVGSVDCVQNGDLLGSPPAGRTLPGGFDSRCWTVERLVAPAAPIWCEYLWLKPESLQGFADGNPVYRWIDSGLFGRDAVQDIRTFAPLYRSALLNGFPGLQFDMGDALKWIIPLPLGTEISSYLVGINSSISGAQQIGPNLVSSPLTSFGCPSVEATVMSYTDSLSGFSLLTAPSYGVPGIWCCRRLAGSIELTHVGDMAGSGSISPSGVLSLSAIACTPFGVLSKRRCYILEVLVWDRMLTDLEHNGVIQYLRSKYGI